MTKEQEDLFGGLDNIVKDRLLQVKHNGAWRFMHHIDVNTHQPRFSRRAEALRLTARTAETIRFNLTARGFAVRVHEE